MSHINLDWETQTKCFCLKNIPSHHNLYHKIKEFVEDCLFPSDNYVSLRMPGYPMMVGYPMVAPGSMMPLMLGKIFDIIMRTMRDSFRKDNIMPHTKLLWKHLRGVI